MRVPEFRVVGEDGAEGVTYECGCPCEPVARPGPGGEAGFEHCCCGKVHFVGGDAARALGAYLRSRKESGKEDPEYTVGATVVALAGAQVPVAWAFPVE